MVRRHDHQRIVPFAGRLQQLEDAAAQFIRPFGRQRVVEQIAAHDVVVGEVLRNHDVGRISPGADAGVAIIVPVWLQRADPKTERMPCPPLGQKFSETSHHVEIDHLGEGAA